MKVSARDACDWRRVQRREFLSRTACGLGAMALGTLVPGASHAAQENDPGTLGSTHFPAKAKRVIYLFQSGGPSHLDLFDPKPILSERQGEEVPASVLGTQRVSLMTRDAGRKACPSPFAFQQHGQAGVWITERMPRLAGVVDDLCFLNAVQTEPINHDPAVTFMQTGRAITGRPAFGSWMHWGLGNESNELPAYVVMTSGPVDQPILSRYYHSGFLPSRCQGVAFQSTGDPVLFLSPPAGLEREGRGRMIEAVNRINRQRYERIGDPEIEARIDAYEMAYRMQTSVPGLMDLSDETRETLELYGPDAERPGTYAYQCLMARRLAERGVRFVQIFHAGWDHHGGLREGLMRQTDSCDRGSAALIEDLKRRGMLEETLVVWGGEFGRTAYSQGGELNGRDHHPRCFTMWLAGGGVRGGTAYGKTDEWGYNVAEQGVQVRDLHATMLHLLGIDHERFTFRHRGLDDRLTGVEPARVVQEILS